MKRTVRLASMFVTMFTGSIAFASGHHLPGYDAYFDAPQKLLRPLATRAVTPEVRAGVASIDEKRGVPTIFFAPAKAQGASARQQVGQSPAVAAKFYLQNYAHLYGLGSGALDSAYVGMVHDTGRGGIIVTLRQKAAGIDVLGTATNVLLTRDNDLVAITGNLHPLASAKMGRAAKFVHGPGVAISRAFNDFCDTKVPPGSFVDARSERNGYSFYTMNDTPETLARNIGLARPARIKKVYYPLPDALVPAYYVEIAGTEKTSTSSVLYAYVIAANDGRLLKRMSLTQDAAFTYRVWAQGAPNFTPTDGPMADYTPHPTGMPDGSVPAFVSPSLVTVDGFNKNPSNTFDPWLAAGATQTSGNNVDAYADISAPDGFSGSDLRASTTASATFDRTYDTSQSPTGQNQRQAAVTQLFYDNNYYHDYWYDSGFDEAAGNAQADNFGRGGLGNDPILAEGQDFSGTDNANMQTPADGDSPIMQMYVFSPPMGSNVPRDGTIDGGIIAHEWGHYLHMRLSNPGMTAQGDAMSEGWGDFQAIMQLVHPDDNTGSSFSGVFATGVYAAAAFGDSAYYGIRRAPYSKDMNKNGLTFKHIGDSAQLPPNMQSFGNNNAEAHNAGEIWCTMLWEAYSNLLDDTLGGSPRHTFDQAKRKMADYVVGGLKLAPSSMTFTEQRDAILAAAVAAGKTSGDYSDFEDLAAGFAKRGAGKCAQSPSRNSVSLDGVVESFTASPEAAVVSASLTDAPPSCDADGILDAGEVGKLVITVRNTGWSDLTGATLSVSSSNPNISFPDGTSAPIPTTAVFADSVITLKAALSSGVTASILIPVDITINAPGTCNTSQTFNESIGVHSDSAEPNTPNASTTETFDGVTKTWTASLASGADTQLWSIVQPVAGDANQMIWGQNIEGVSDHRYESPDLMVGSGTFTMTFKHRYQFEFSQGTFWDGAVIEYSADGGTTWDDVSALPGVNPGYTGTIEASGNNPLGGKLGYTDATAGFDFGTMVSQTIDFGSALANKTVKVRFRLGTDEAVGAGGWYIDDVAFTGLTNKPFSTKGIEDGVCVNNVPIADAGPDQASMGGAAITLDGSGSSDPDNAPMPLTYSWSQTAGPNVALSGGTSATPSFTAPATTADTVLTFQLTVSDGEDTATDTVDITLKPGGEGGAGSGGDGGGGVSCECSVPGNDEPSPLRALGSSMLALFGAWALRRRRQNRTS